MAIKNDPTNELVPPKVAESGGLEDKRERSGPRGALAGPGLQRFIAKSSAFASICPLLFCQSISLVVE